ncbi:OprO/OprP family phosphate-selective porin [Aequorivita marina]|uniref:OprO/OprP family phosphate-selective porin n=1 Tax=Aequorivita marina TaxID=3073654 RepID=UPI0028743945|nr:porin [Aequorivita sp. S2608]MDS1297391.1 porin [Aequorivita sp. S2608]
MFSQENTTNPFSFKWDNGFKLTSQDNQFALKFGGRIMVDHAYLFQNDALSENFGPLVSKSGTEIRRARLFFSGDIYENTHFKFQVDFAGDEVSIKDVYIGFSNIPIVGNLQIGHFKEPFRLSSVTSSKFTTFMEPAQNTAFAQSRNNGIMVSNNFLDKRLSAQLSTFRNANNNSDDAFADDGYIITGRLTGLAIRNNQKNKLLHLGIGYSYRKPESKEYQVAARPGAHLAPKYISTGTLENVDAINLINLEAAYLHGPFSFQGEYLNASVETHLQNLNFSNYYGEISYFITGESKNYKGSYDGFGRVKPKKNFNKKDRGAGAWEIAFRYSNTNLTDAYIAGGKQTDITLGLNWYINPVTKLMINHVWANTDNQGNANILQGRIQIDF